MARASKFPITYPDHRSIVTTSVAPPRIHDHSCEPDITMPKSRLRSPPPMGQRPLPEQFIILDVRVHHEPHHIPNHHLDHFLGIIISERRCQLASRVVHQGTGYIVERMVQLGQEVT